MTRKTQRILKTIIPYLLVVLLGALLVLGVWLATDPGSGTESGEDIEVDFSDFPTVAALDVAGVDKLIMDYYAAKTADDAAALNQLVDSETEYNVVDLANEMQYISKYDSFKSYIIPGPSEEYFVAYVKYEIYFSGISTGAPSLNHFLVKKTGDSYIIYDAKLTPEQEAYMEETENSETVQKLKEQVNKELDKACEENEDLRLLMKLLKGEGEVVDPGSAESSSSENASETASETNSEEEK